MKTKVLVLGATGMLGHMVLKVLSQNEPFEIRGTYISDPADLFYFNVEEGLDKLSVIYDENNGFDYIINCIGITANKIAPLSSSSIIRAIEINAVFPHRLAELAKKKGTRIIHISTDGVFSGSAECYDEEVPCDCTDIYGKTKSLGEVVNNNVLNIRCSIIGPSPFEKGGLLEWFQSQPEGSKIPGYTNHFWNGISTVQFAELCQKIISSNQFDKLREESGVFHFAPNQVVSKYELLTIFKSVFNKNITIVLVESKGAAIKRILTSKYKGLKRLCDYGLPMEKAIKQLKDSFSNKEH